VSLGEDSAFSNVEQVRREPRIRPHEASLKIVSELFLPLNCYGKIVYLTFLRGKLAWTRRYIKNCERSHSQLSSIFAFL
jgi:hypothetical protein